MDRHGGPAWDEAAFTALREHVGKELPSAAGDVLADAVRVLEAWRVVDRALTGSVDLPLLPAMADMRSQVAGLVGRGFVADTGAAQLRQLPRYLEAVRLRRERLAASPARDQALMDQVLPLQEAYRNRVAALRPDAPEPLALRRVRWMVEELRVSLWAQQLGTAFPVSDARIRKALAAA
jgi:ATP-dependent helicase HrpA